MFELYTQAARATIFGARYIAMQAGSPQIESEHLLLGLLRADKRLADRFFGSPWAAETVWKKLEQRKPIRGKVAGTKDEIPLDEMSKRALFSALEEADSLSPRRIGTGNILLGLLREEGSLAAQLLTELGVHLASTRAELSRMPHDDSVQEEYMRDRGSMPKEIIELEARVKAAKADVENAVSNNDFDRAKAASDEEGTERDKLISLYREHGLLDWIYA